MWNRTLFFLLFAILVSFSRVNAQVDSVTVQKVSIINAKHKVEGIYKTFDEFKGNEPSYRQQFEVVNANDSIRNPDFTDKIVVQSNGQQVSRSADKIFGYCRNDTVYVSLWRFHPIVEFGHLCLIWVSEVQQHVSVKESLYGTGLTNTGPTISDDASDLSKKQVRSWYVLDMSNGRKFELNRDFLSKKFKETDAEIYKSFVSTGQNENPSVQLEFIRKFNQRNPIRF